MEAPAFQFQAGGHPGRLNLDQSAPDRLIKQTVEREAAFYEVFGPKLDQSRTGQLATEGHAQEVVARPSEPWSGWRPKYFGRLAASTESRGGTGGLEPGATSNPLVWVSLENLTAAQVVRSGVRQPGVGFKQPNVIDVKLGQTFYDPDSSPEKMERMIRAAAETTSAKFGIRLTGAKIFDNKTQTYHTFGKDFGKSLDPQSASRLSHGLNSFFPVSQRNHLAAEEGLCYSEGALGVESLKWILKKVLMPQLVRLIDHVSGFNWRIYASSLLIVYEGDRATVEALISSPPSSADGRDLDNRAGLVKMIDFAHAWPAPEPDPGLLLGFKSLLSFLKDLLDRLEAVHPAPNST